MMMIPRKRNEFDLFRDFFEGDDFFPIRRESAIMKTDIKEKKDKYIIEMDLPGYEKENIKLSLKDGYLEVTAEVNKEDENEEKEKGIIAQEIKMYDDDPISKVFLNSLQCMYNSCPVRIDVAGTVESINKITKENVRIYCTNTLLQKLKELNRKEKIE